MLNRGVYILTVKDNTLSLTDHNMVFGTNRKTPMLNIAKSASGGLYCSPDHLQQNIEHRKLSIETLSHLLKACKRVCRRAENRTFFYTELFSKKLKRSGTSGPSGVSGVLFTAIYGLLPQFKAPAASWSGQTISNVWPTSTQKKWATSGPEAGQVGQQAHCQPNVFLYGIFKRSKTSGTSGTSGTVEYRIHNLLPFIAIQGFYRRLEWTNNI